MSHSLQNKVETGDRPLTPAVAAALGKALGVTMADILVPASVAADDEQLLNALRSAIRDFDLPNHQAVTEELVAAGIEAADRYRRAVDVTALMPMLAPLLRHATTHAHTANTAGAWSALADVYSTVYWLAAHHRWMDIAELAVTRQRWAAEQQPNAPAVAVAARDRAGTYLNFGDVERGLVVVDRAITVVQSAPLGTVDRDLAVGILNLRGMTLAGRLQDEKERRREAERHIRSAWHAAESFTCGDVAAHELTFGPQNVLPRLRHPGRSGPAAHRAVPHRQPGQQPAPGRQSSAPNAVWRSMSWGCAGR